MCLYINRNKHRISLFDKRRFKAIKLREDKWVWKELVYYNGVWTTPYMGKVIRFNPAGVYVLPAFSKEVFEDSVEYDYYYNYLGTGSTVGRKGAYGYHAYTTEKASLGGRHLFKAKIPKGSYAYYGDDDICANQMIIYED